MEDDKLAPNSSISQELRYCGPLSEACILVNPALLFIYFTAKAKFCKLVKSTFNVSHYLGVITTILVSQHPIPQPSIKGSGETQYKKSTNWNATSDVSIDLCILYPTPT